MNFKKSTKHAQQSKKHNFTFPEYTEKYFKNSLQTNDTACINLKEKTTNLHSDCSTTRMSY